MILLSQLFLYDLKNEKSREELLSINEKSQNIKQLQEKYADAYSKNQSIKNESIKRNERIKTIETEIESWINLLSNSEKMVAELTGVTANSIVDCFDGGSGCFIFIG